MHSHLRPTPAPRPPSWEEGLYLPGGQGRGERHVIPCGAVTCKGTAESGCQHHGDSPSGKNGTMLSSGQLPRLSPRAPGAGWGLMGARAIGARQRISLLLALPTPEPEQCQEAGMDGQTTGREVEEGADVVRQVRMGLSSLLILQCLPPSSWGVGSQQGPRVAAPCSPPAPWLLGLTGAGQVADAAVGGDIF